MSNVKNLNAELEAGGAALIAMFPALERRGCTLSGWYTTDYAHHFFVGVMVCGGMGSSMAFLSTPRPSTREDHRCGYCVQVKPTWCECSMCERNRGPYRNPAVET